jgi:hypothetical protein
MKILFSIKYLIGENHLIWDQIILMSEKMRNHFDVLQQKKSLERTIWIEVAKAS